MTIAVVAAAVVLAVLAVTAARILREYERAVVFRLGRLRPLRGPGPVLLWPLVDRMVRVDLRTITLTVPPQEAISRDNVPVRVNAVVYFRVIDPVRSVIEVENHAVATSQIAQTTLRSVLGREDLDTLLSERDQLNTNLRKIMDEQTEPWGVKVSLVEIKDVEIPEAMQRAIGRQAEAERERRGPNHPFLQRIRPKNETERYFCHSSWADSPLVGWSCSHSRPALQSHERASSVQSHADSGVGIALEPMG